MLGGEEVAALILRFFAQPARPFEPQSQILLCYQKASFYSTFLPDCFSFVTLIASRLQKMT